MSKLITTRQHRVRYSIPGARLLGTVCRSIRQCCSPADTATFTQTCDGELPTPYPLYLPQTLYLTLSGFQGMDVSGYGPVYSAPYTTGSCDPTSSLLFLSGWTNKTYELEYDSADTAFAGGGIGRRHFYRLAGSSLIAPSTIYAADTDAQVPYAFGLCGPSHPDMTGAPLQPPFPAGTIDGSLYGIDTGLTFQVPCDANTILFMPNDHPFACHNGGPLLIGTGAVIQMSPSCPEYFFLWNLNYYNTNRTWEYKVYISAVIIISCDCTDTFSEGAIACGPTAELCLYTMLVRSFSSSKGGSDFGKYYGTQRDIFIVDNSFGDSVSEVDLRTCAFFGGGPPYCTQTLSDYSQPTVIAPRPDRPLGYSLACPTILNPGRTGRYDLSL